MRWRAHLRRLATMAMLATGPALAQTPPAPVVSKTPETLSKKLDQTNGVIQPPNVDPKMDKPAPVTGDQNVIGTPGATTAPQAK